MRMLGCCLLFIFICQKVSPQSIDNERDYKEIFDKDYLFAINTTEKNSWWSDTLLADGIDPDFVLAVIFPELIRYSSIEDYVQVKALEVLYVQYGRDYADFSVGLFQMKPTFAERIEKDIVNFGLTEIFPVLAELQPDTSETTICRAERITRLKDEYFQVLYLEAFIRVMDTIYPDKLFKSAADKLIFYATAYNTGYFKDESEIEKEILRKRFYLGMKASSTKYNYSDIALEYYMIRQ